MMADVIDAVVFDLDGVLVDSEPVWEEVRRAVVARWGGRWKPETQARLMGMSTPGWARYLSAELGTDLSPEQVADVVVSQIADRYAEALPLMPGAVAALRRLAPWRPLGLASSTPRRLIDAVLAAAKVADLFATIVSTEEVGRGKAAPDVYLAAAERLAVPVDRCQAPTASTPFTSSSTRGTKLIPCDFIGVAAPLSSLEGQHDLLLANLFAQTEGLAFGRSAAELRQAGSSDEQIPHRVCEGNRPTTTLLLDRLTPRSLGTLVGLYEHKVFTEGTIWDIDSFDQWGVELGKLLANAISDELTAEQAPTLHHDESTNQLIRRYRGARGRST
ncbi:MAG: HAD family hydrolase [Propionibacteriaceae bacterium]